MPEPRIRLRLKKLYSSREVAALTGLSARQLQWWHARGLFAPSIAPQRTAAGGYTERRYTPVELLELMVLADLRRRDFSVATIRKLLTVLRDQFGVRLFEAIEGGGPITLFVDGRRIFARTEGGDLYNLLEHPEQPLLEIGDAVRMRQLVAREGKKREVKKPKKVKKGRKDPPRRTASAPPSDGSETRARGPRPDAE